MVNADSDEDERSSERSDGCRSVSFHLDTHGSSLSYSLWCTCTKRDEGLWSLWAALAPSTEGWETRAPSARVSRLCRGVFHASGRIHRPGASRRPPRMPQERRARPRAPPSRPLEILDTARRGSAQPAEDYSISVLVGRCSPVRAPTFAPVSQHTCSARSPSAVGCRISLKPAQFCRSLFLA